MKRFRGVGEWPTTRTRKKKKEEEKRASRNGERTAHRVGKNPESQKNDSKGGSIHKSRQGLNFGFGGGSAPTGRGLVRV